MGNRTPQAVKEKGKTESAALSAASRPRPSQEGSVQSSPRLWVGSWETVEQLKGQQAGKDRGLWKSSPRIIPFLFKLRKLKMGFSDLHSLSSVMHFVRNATWTPWHKQNSLVAGSHFRGVARWLQGPPRHPTGLAHSQMGPSSLPVSSLFGLHAQPGPASTELPR